MNYNIEPFHQSYFEELLFLIDINTPIYFAPEEKAHFQNYLENEMEDYFVILSDHKVIGCGGINYPGDSTAVITWDMLHPEYQGHGLGSNFFNYRLEVIKKKEGINKLIVRTSQMAFPFYEYQGFKLIEVKKDYWAKGFDLYHMEMEEF